MMNRLYTEIQNRKANPGIFDGIEFINGTVKNPQRPPKVSKKEIKRWDAIKARSIKLGWIIK